MLNLPAGNITSLLIDYTQRIFGDPNQTPDNYRWSSEGRETLINISAFYPIDEEKPFNIPAIRMQRGQLAINEQINDNFIEAEDTHSSPQVKGFLYEGPFTIIVSARTPIEASNIAQFLSMRMQNDKDKIINAGRDFLRNFNIRGISEEQPKESQGKVHRYEVLIHAWVSIMNLIQNKIVSDKPLNIISMHGEGEYFKGQISGNAGDNYVTDSEHTFGFDNTYDFYFDSTELSDNRYYIRFNNCLYQVTGITDENSLYISALDEDDKIISNWSLDESVSNASYELFWNIHHLHWIIKND